MKNNKCPKCKGELEIKKEELCSSEQKVASATDERHGYFGETPAEYGASDRDRYQKFTEIKEIGKCRSCGHITVNTYIDVSESYCKY